MAAESNPEINSNLVDSNDDSPKETELSERKVSKSNSILVGEIAIPSPMAGGNRAFQNSQFVGPVRKTQSFVDKVELVQIYE